MEECSDVNQHNVNWTLAKKVYIGFVIEFLWWN